MVIVKYVLETHSTRKLFEIGQQMAFDFNFVSHGCRDKSNPFRQNAYLAVSQSVIWEIFKQFLVCLPFFVQSFFVWRFFSHITRNATRLPLTEIVFVISIPSSLIFLFCYFYIFMTHLTRSSTRSLTDTRTGTRMQTWWFGRESLFALVLHILHSFLSKSALNNFLRVYYQKTNYCCL